MKTRISTDLGDPKLLKLIKMEAQETNSTMKEIIKKALEAYFFHKLELKALQKASESIFEEWDNELDSDYDNL